MEIENTDSVETLSDTVNPTETAIYESKANLLEQFSSLVCLYEKNRKDNSTEKKLLELEIKNLRENQNDITLYKEEISSLKKTINNLESQLRVLYKEKLLGSGKHQKMVKSMDAQLRCLYSDLIEKLGHEEGLDIEIECLRSENKRLLKMVSSFHAQLDNCYQEKSENK
jgi:hypothetical protein